MVYDLGWLEVRGFLELAAERAEENFSWYDLAEIIMAISRHGRSRLLLLGCEEPSPFLPSKKLAESSKSTRCVEQVCSPRQPILFFWSNFGSQECATAAFATLALLLGCNLWRKSAQRLLEILLRFMATLSQVFSKGIANMFSRRASSHSHNYIWS